MNRSEFLNECGIRLKADEGNIHEALVEYALKLDFSDKDTHKLILPILKAMLKDLRKSSCYLGDVITVYHKSVITS